MSLLTPVLFASGSLTVCWLRRMSRNPTNSFLSVLCAAVAQLLFTDFHHILFDSFFQNRPQKYNIFSIPPNFLPHFFAQVLIGTLKNNRR
jgi:hypothetical protein